MNNLNDIRMSNLSSKIDTQEEERVKEALKAERAEAAKRAEKKVSKKKHD